MTQTLTESQTARAAVKHVKDIMTTYGTVFPNQAGFIVNAKDHEWYSRVDMRMTQYEPKGHVFVIAETQMVISPMDGERWDRDVKREAFLDALIATQMAKRICDTDVALGIDKECIHTPKCDGKVVYGA